MPTHFLWYAFYEYQVYIIGRILKFRLFMKIIFLDFMCVFLYQKKLPFQHLNSLDVCVTSMFDLIPFSTWKISIYPKKRKTIMKCRKNYLWECYLCILKKNRDWYLTQKPRWSRLCEYYFTRLTTCLKTRD